MHGWAPGPFDRVDDADQWLGGTAEATVTGQLLDGASIEGSDSICAVLEGGEGQATRGRVISTLPFSFLIPLYT